MTAPPLARTIWILALLTLCAGAGADTVTLRPSVVIKPDTAITLGLIAELEGPHAERLADVVVAASTEELPKITGPEGPSQRWRLDLPAIREIIDGAPGVNWAFISLRGRHVTLIGPDRQPDTKKPEAPTRASKEQQEPQGISTFEEGTLGAFARSVVRTILRTNDSDLRMIWPSKDAPFLSEPVAGRTVHVEPIGTSARMPLEITIYDGDRIVRRETVRAKISVRRTVHTMSRSLARRTPISASDFTTRTAWIAPGITPATSVIGQVTSRRLEPGTIIEIGDTTPPYVVERGELLMLHCVSGAVALRTPARALEDARDGETVSVEMEATGRRVLARMNGRGNAVLVVRENTPIGGTDPARGQSTNGERRP